MTCIRTNADPATAPVFMTVNLGAVAANYALLKSKVSAACAIGGILKADAYGLGMEKIWAVLENHDCPLYYVATAAEGFALRRLTRKPVAVLDGVTEKEVGDYIYHNLTPVLNSLHDIALWQKAAAQRQIPLEAILHFDTGMNRLGLGADEAATLRNEPERLEGLKVKQVMSHFACADEKDHPMTKAQYDLFMAVAAQFPGAKKSIANSSGIFRDSACHLDMVRPGMALFGLNPTPEMKNPMRPVVALHSRILQVRKAAKGETAGYGAAYRIEKDTVLATIAAGYADGIFRSLGNRGVVYHNGKACPVAGRVSMDLITVDLGCDSPAQPGDLVEIIGPRQSADDVAAAAGTIGYEVLTRIGAACPRRYKS